MYAGTIAILALLLVTPNQGAKPAEVSSLHQPPARQPPPQPNATRAMKEIHAKEGEDGGGTKNSGDNPSAPPDPWPNRFQGATALFTGLYFGATVWILCEMRRSNRRSLSLAIESNRLTRDSLHAAHRPYLVADEFKTNESPSADRETMTCVARVTNAGTTGANNVISSSKFVDVPSGEAIDIRHILLNTTPNTGTPILSVGVHGTFGMECTTSMYPERQQKLARGEIDLCFVGVVTYQDFFEIWHRYWFSYRGNSQGEWLPYRNHRQTGGFDAHMAWATTAKLSPPQQN